jgi:glycosidase
MEIFVRGYQDSDGDGIGDLKGLTSRLDYLKDLGIKGIWLMPITASADHDHGYATTDFRAIEAPYGTLADFDEFIKQAHARGIGVIIDYVINHSARSHPLFTQSASGPESPYRDWYVWDDPAQHMDTNGWEIWGKNPWIKTSAGSYFATFGAPMPDFNMKNPAVVEYHRSSLRFWLNRGLDGFRLDAVPHLVEKDAKDWNDQPESRVLTGQFQDLVKSYPQRFTVCEATASPTAYADPKVCGSAFAFGLQYDIVKAAKGDPQAIQAVADYFKTAPLSMGTMLSNHDIFAGERAWDQFKGDLAAYRLAAATYLLLPGTPFIYYGEEVGMAGVADLAGDAPLRAPMSWTGDIKGFSTGLAFRPVSPNAASHNAAFEQGDPASLLSFYKAMLRLRNDDPSLAQGSYEAATVNGALFSFQRRYGRQLSVVVINYGSSQSQLQLSGLPPNSRLQANYPAQAKPVRSDRKGRLSLSLPGQSVAVYTVHP